MTADPHVAVTSNWRTYTHSNPDICIADCKQQAASPLRNANKVRDLFPILLIIFLSWVVTHLLLMSFSPGASLIDLINLTPQLV